MLHYLTMTVTKPEQPDTPPKNLHVGAINPFALVEAILGRKLDWNSASTSRIIAAILQTDYDELFDMSFNSVLYAGLKLNDREEAAEPIDSKDIHTLTERDLLTPDFSRIKKLSDLGYMGLKDLGGIRVKHAVMTNGNLRMTLEPPRSLGKTLSNSEFTALIRDLATPYRSESQTGGEKKEWTPPNGIWTDVSSLYRQDATKFNNPVQGATGNSWLIAALMSVAWSDPSSITHCNQTPAAAAAASSFFKKDKTSEDSCTLSIKLYSKGGHLDAPTQTVTVNAQVPLNTSSEMVMYARSSDEGEIWPCLYEKAFAKWISSSSSSSSSSSKSPSSEHPDLTLLSRGDPVKAMAQLTDKTPEYFFTSSRREQDLLGLVRSHCVNLRTIYPLVAYTHPTFCNNKFRGATLVGNMAYSVLGWAAPQERKQYIILRHPWGVCEPDGLTSYSGLVTKVDTKFWPPVELLDAKSGVFAIETGAFREVFAGMGVAK
ncbi:hypothetical protein QBC41DRAFT_270052 [Cercophora samala]|uniref:Calpain catalytic domain-containing protein n=1 Tax=Cercophora samala TaxID=330535 RepID=A0AA39ZIJ8_9PEZI|nr:hypothetical protein QBC41DRAFT_270052 [Cercophora samala]